jgi:hypothetical protein
MPKRRKGRLLLKAVLLLFLAGVIWALVSRNPFAQGIQQALGSKPDQTVLAKSFTVPAHGLRYYTFSLPSDSKNVSLVGHFTSSGGDVEAFVLSEPSFTDWQEGSTANSIYESGRISQGSLRRDMPSGAGVYYIVFSNRFDPQSSKNVNAVVRMRYSSWMPDWMRRSSQ